MEATQDDVNQAIEPQFLSAAQAGAIKLRVGQMNKTEHEGTIRDIGRYEINLDVNGSVVTLLKREITHFAAPRPVIAPPPQQEAPSAAPQAKPNVQQEFLDKAIREKHVLTIFLVNGTRLKANILAYDNFTILLNEGDGQQLYYKHAITTINR